MMLAFRLARRDLGGLRIVLACLALGVAAIATVGGLRSAITGGIAAHGRDILGGDLEITAGLQPLPDALPAWLLAHGARLSRVAQMQSMLVAGNGERELVELKAVDGAWPLAGQAVFTPARKPGSVPRGLAVEPLVLQRLNIRLGETVRLGNITLPVTEVLQQEPDHAASPSLLGPRALVALDLLPRTGLVQPGSIITRAVRVAWRPGADPAALTAALQAAFPANGWHLRDPHDAVPGATRFIDHLAVFMTLVGLASLLVGGIGVATGVRAWLEGRARAIAILRCLGASGRLVFAVVLIQVGILAAAGIALGLAAGALLPLGALWLFRDALPVPPALGVYGRPLALAAGFGALAALVFALPPLARAMRIPGGALFRNAVLPQPGRPALWLLALVAGLAAALVALIVATSPQPRLAAGFCLACLVTLGVFRLGAAGLGAAARAARQVGPAAMRLGIGNLYRPGNATVLMLIALGLGLSVLVSVGLIQGNMAAQIGGQMPRHAPSFYFIDIQPDQVGPFRRVLAAQPDVSDVAELPYMPSRVSAVNGVPAEQVTPTPQTAWALRGARGLALTYADAPPKGTKIVAGAWWPKSYAGPPLVSFDANLARGWRIGLGDTLTVTILGRPVTMRIASLREIEWRSLSMNFAMVASPGLLSGAPHTELATVRVPPAAEGRLLRAVTDALPNVTGIRVADVLASVGKLLSQVGAALGATGSLTLAAGALVLAGAVASGQRRRIAEAVVLRSLGATRSQIRAAWLIEFGALGLTAGLIATVIGTAASFAMMHWVLQAPWSVLPGRLALILAGCVLMMLAFGYAGTETALRARPARLLRN